MARPVTKPQPEQKLRQHVFLTMRAKLLERGVKCTRADDYAWRAMKLYKRAVRRGCEAAFDTAISDATADRFAKLEGLHHA